MTIAMPERLVPFPPERADRMRTPALLAERGFSLRALHDGDLPWLRDLYASTRAEEMAQVPCTEAAKRAFLDQQCALQHNHYIATFGDSDFLAIERGRIPLGRFYLQRAAPEHLIVDIALFPKARGDGIGSALILGAQRGAAAEHCGMRLHVKVTNPAAQRLYERLGFVLVPEAGTSSHRLMHWRPTAV